MEIYRTEDGKVTKYVHDDGSETSIKHAIAEDCGGNYGKVTNKFNVFISSSVGCPVKCKFCYLTVKKFPFHNLESAEIVSNVIDAIKDQVKVYPELKGKYVKLSWMGMGDPCINFMKTIDSTDMIIRRIMEQKLCKGIDGIDIGTTMPSTAGKGSILHGLELFNALMLDFPRNPLRTAISPFRIFYSLHGTSSIRNDLIPKSMDITDAWMELHTIPPNQAKVIIHHMLLDGINDSDYDIKDLLKLMKHLTYKNDHQLRILRYNSCTNSPYVESTRFHEIIKRIHNNIPDVKVQASPGSEVKASCGMFLLGDSIG